MGIEERLMAVGPIDGRYATTTEPLQPIVSEFGLIQRRLQVGVRWVSVLGSGILPDRPPLSDNAQDTLLAIPGDFTLEDAIKIKEIESVTNHDANAVVRWLKDRLRGDDNIRDYAEMVHYGGTSEDTNNLAFALMVRDARDEVLDPNISAITADLYQKSQQHAGLAQLARTHGQAASPTTLGKEMAVYVDRLTSHREALGSIGVVGKFNGATGNYSAASFAYPEVDWPAASRKLVDSFGIKFSEVTTQIEPHDWMARFFNELALGNTILTDLSRDEWIYIMLNELAQEVVPGEDGSSAMPNKVNPIQFENAEANFGLANALLNHLANKLPISRLQRDLSDSSAQRAIGEAFGHTLIGYSSLKKALRKVHPNQDGIKANLDDEWAVLMEPVQTVMRRYNVEGAYDAIKEASRGKTIGQEEYLELVRSLDIPQAAKDRLLALTPATYTGRAAQIARGEY